MMTEELTNEEDRALHEVASALILLNEGRDVDKKVIEAVSTLLHIYKSQESQSKDEKIASQADKKQKKKKRKVMEKDDSEVSLNKLIQWIQIKPETPPFLRDADTVGVCSEPLRKQMQESDVKENQCRLMLGKTQVEKMMNHVMKKEEIEELKAGLEVSVYGRDGQVHKMTFKKWNGSTPVLMSSGWNKFVGDYDLKMHSCFLTLWMFRHSRNDNVCFAIDFIEFEEMKKQLSRRLLNKL